MCKYAMEIFYSEEDNGYIVVVPGLPGCSAFGETEEKALEKVKIAIELWLKAATKEGREIPVPHGEGLLDTLVESPSRGAELAGI